MVGPVDLATDLTFFFVLFLATLVALRGAWVRATDRFLPAAFRAAVLGLAVFRAAALGAAAFRVAVLRVAGRGAAARRGAVRPAVVRLGTALRFGVAAFEDRKA